ATAKAGGVPMRAYYGEPLASGPFQRQVDNHTRWFDESAEIPEAIAQQVKDRQIVMLGEATHGTSEFYSLRAEITKHLIRDHGFRFVAVEGDWPACFAVNRAVKRGEESVDESLQHFNRWPTWMWANEEVR